MKVPIAVSGLACRTGGLARHRAKRDTPRFALCATNPRVLHAQACVPELCAEVVMSHNGDHKVRGGLF